MLASCTLFTDFGGLHDGATSSGEGGGGGATDGSSPAETSTADGPTNVTPSNEAGPRPSPCLAAHEFCDDFDAPSLVLPGKWEDMRQAAGPVTLDTVQFLSAPRSLKVELAS